MPRTSVAGLPDDFGKWLALAGALAALGILPKGWQKMIAGLGAAVAIISFFE
jgi:hypothetical protein